MQQSENSNNSEQANLVRNILGFYVIVFFGAFLYSEIQIGNLKMENQHLEFVKDSIIARQMDIEMRYKKIRSLSGTGNNHNINNN